MSNQKLPGFKLLTGFEAAARLGNYSRAADELCISQSAVSHQVAQLERHIGQPLFRRKGRGVELTVAGRLLHESVVRSLDLIRAGLGRIDTYLDASLVTIVCPAPLAHGWLQPRLEQLVPPGEPWCPIVSIDETARYIDELDVDIAITRQPLHQAGVHEELLLTDAMVVVATPGLVAPTGCMFLETDLTAEGTGAFIRTHLGELRKVAIYDDPRLLLDAALRGRGLALVSRLMAASALASNDLVVVPGYPGAAADSYWISRAAGTVRSDLVGTVYDSLVRLSRAEDHFNQLSF